MSPLKFCANVSWLFTELPDFSQRLCAAAAAGFQAVEAAWLYDCELRELQRARQAAGVDVVLINTPPGDLEAGDLGLGAVPGREAEFRQGLDLAVTYAKALDCKRIHLMAGRLPVGSTRSAVAKEMEAIFVQNLNYAADLLSKEGITGLIEPINTRITDPRYFLDSPHQAAEILEKVGKPNLKLQMDVFHWQIMDGNLTQNMLKYFPIIDHSQQLKPPGQRIDRSEKAEKSVTHDKGHIQVAQVPGRNEPDSAGELNYSYLFQTLEEHSYQGYIGCEYKPRGSTKDGLGWIRDYWTRRE